MSDVTRILQSIEHGDPKAAEQLLPLVYEELRRLAAHKMAHEPPGQTLQATALVHEAYLKLALEDRRFGVVYMAEQREPVVRRVALKIIKLGMDTKQVIARFEAERRALAMMDHPNIARVSAEAALIQGSPTFAWNWFAAFLSLSFVTRII